MAIWRCVGCGYSVSGMDEVPGYSDLAGALENIDSKKDLPEDWECPECGAGKDKLEKAEE